MYGVYEPAFIYVGAHLQVSDGQFRERKKNDAPIVLCTTDL